MPIIKCTNKLCKKEVDLKNVKYISPTKAIVTCLACGKTIKLFKSRQPKDPIRSKDGSLRRKDPKPLSKKEKRKLRKQKGVS